MAPGFRLSTRSGDTGLRFRTRPGYGLSNCDKVQWKLVRSESGVIAAASCAYGLGKP